tara:strand:- start:790 stop:906 length:117 start_codon:yes stop_codon:yes gene_type:complete
MPQAHKKLFNWFMDEPLLDDLDEELEDIHGFPIKDEEE